MIFGAITNSWRLQLADQDINDLVAEAKARGARHIELRQTCLGDCESGEGEDWRPVLPRLQALVWPCLTRESDPQGEPFQAALAGAKLVGRETPHLRIVDPSGFDQAWESAGDIPAEALAVADLAREAARQGVILSMENSGQPIRSMALLVQQARTALTEEEGLFLGLCPDATNQLRRYPDSDPLAELDAVGLDMIKIIHFKQARDGAAHPTVDTGDLDCLRMQEILEAKGYNGAAIMEIPPDQNVFDNLAASYAFLESGQA